MTTPTANKPNFIHPEHMDSLDTLKVKSKKSNDSKSLFRGHSKRRNYCQTQEE